MKRVLLLIAALAGMLAVWQVPLRTHAQANDAAAVVHSFHAALNAYATGEITPLVSDDFVLKIVYGGPDDVTLTGKQELLDFVEGVKQDNFQLSVSDVAVEGTRVTGKYSGDGDQIRAVGIGPEIGTVEAVVENGVLQSITYTVDPDYNKRFADAVAAPDKLPTTGADLNTSYAPALALGLGLLVLGLALWNRNKRQT